MNTINLIRAWKDAEYRATLSAEELAALPQHPAGLVELPEEEMAAVAGAAATSPAPVAGSAKFSPPSMAVTLRPTRKYSQH